MTAANRYHERYYVSVLDSGIRQLTTLTSDPDEVRHYPLPEYPPGLNQQLNEWRRWRDALTQAMRSSGDASEQYGVFADLLGAALTEPGGRPCLTKAEAERDAERQITAKLRQDLAIAEAGEGGRFEAEVERMIRHAKVAALREFAQEAEAAFQLPRDFGFEVRRLAETRADAIEAGADD